MASKVRGLLAAVRKKVNARPKEVYVHGSGLVHVPKDRLNEIPKVIAEYHRLESERAKQIVRTCKRAY